MKYSMFIGRWQPWHKGHRWLIDQRLNEGKNVLICIREVGLATARILSKEYKSIESLIDAKLEKLTNIKDIGPIVANNIIDFFSNKKNIEKLKRLISSGIIIKYKKNKYSKTLSKKIFVITGSFSVKTRKEIEDIIISYGGKVSGSISRKTDFLICGTKPGSKLVKAKEAGVKIIEERDFFKIL